MNGHTRRVPTVMIILGTTGDLVSRKIVPALFDAYKRRQLPEMFQMVGYARRPFTDESFRERLVGAMAGRIDSGDHAELAAFLDRFHYHQGNFQQEEDYHALARRLGVMDGAWRCCSNKLFYLAVPPHYYESIFKHLAASHLTDPCGPGEGWTRVLVEKPFGNDLETAEQLDEQLGKLFREVQIYRIDHYLAKEVIQNILMFRFSNNLFEQAWSHQFIESIEIRLLESLGVEGRGGFYEGLGALKDVGQNHLLQMLAFTTMDHPGRFTADAIRAGRTEVLRSLHLPSPVEIRRDTCRAQYEGFREIEGVLPDSQTETYFRIRATLDSPRWAGVPITIESGKRMGATTKEIVVTFRHPTPCLCPPHEGHQKDRIRFQLEPEEKITVELWAKKPGLTFDTEKRALDLMIRSEETPQRNVEEYKKVLLDAIAGDQTLFVSTDEVRAMWRFIDPIVRSWQQNRVPLLPYPPDTRPIAPE